MLALSWKLNTKENTSNDRTHLFIFIKFIKKMKKNSEFVDEKKMIKAIEEKDWHFTIKRLLWEFNL